MKKARNKSWNNNRFKQNDVKYLFDSFVIYGGTGFYGTQLSAAKGFKTTAGHMLHKGDREYYERVYDIAYTRLKSFKHWTVITLAIVDHGDVVKVHDEIIQVRGHEPDSVVFTDKTHDMKLKMIKSVNPSFLLGVYSISIPSVEITQDEADGYVLQLLDILKERRLLYKVVAEHVFTKRTPEHVLNDLRKVGLRDCLGSSIKATMFGFDAPD